MQATQTNAVSELVELCEYLVDGIENEGLRGAAYDRDQFASIAPRAIAEVERLRAALVELSGAAMLSYTDVDAVAGDEVLEDMRQLVLRLRREGLLPPE